MIGWYGMGFSYHTTYHTTVPYQVLQYAFHEWAYQLGMYLFTFMAFFMETSLMIIKCRLYETVYE